MDIVHLTRILRGFHYFTKVGILQLRCDALE